MNGRRWALGILLLLAACGRPPGEPAPDFTVPTLDGGAFTLSHALAQGKPVVVFFMAYWCAACLPEAQALGRLRQAYGDHLEIVAIDVDPTSTPEALKAFAEAAGDPPIRWAFDPDNRVVLAYRVTRLDTTLVIAPGGQVVYRDEVPTADRVLFEQVGRLLGPPTP